MTQLQDVNGAIKALQRLSRDKAVEVLRRFGAARTTELTPEQYRAVIALAEQEIRSESPAEGSHECAVEALPEEHG